MAPHETFPPARAAPPCAFLVPGRARRPAAPARPCFLAAPRRSLTGEKGRPVTPALPGRHATGFLPPDPPIRGSLLLGTVVAARFEHQFQCPYTLGLTVRCGPLRERRALAPLERPHPPDHPLRRTAPAFVPPPPHAGPPAPLQVPPALDPPPRGPA